MYRIVIMYIIFILSLCFSQIKVGDDAPTFFVRDLNEKKFFLSDTLELHKPIVLSFFATWCAPCKIEMPILDTLSREYSDVHFYLINVSGLTQGSAKLKEDPIKVQNLITKLGISLPVLMDKYGKIAEKYEVKSLPRLVVIDPEGKLYYIHDGYKKGDETKLKDILTEFANVKE